MLYLYLLGLLAAAAVFVAVLSRPSGPARLELPRAGTPNGLHPALHLARSGRRRRVRRR